MSRVLKRRTFLRKCSAAFGASFVPTSVRGAPFAGGQSAKTEFHLHPHYREQALLETVMLKINPSLDEFVTEQHHETLAAIFEVWRVGLLESPQNLTAIERSLSVEFIGTAWLPANDTLARPSASGLEVRQLSFSSEANQGKTAFLGQMRASFASFSKMLVVDFKITRIDPALKTLVRYELVGTGEGFHREQRVGVWAIEWEAGGREVVRWRALEEVRSTSAEALFREITLGAFGANASYSSQMLHGADHWRTVLDGACGIDIYGHNGVSVGDIDGDGHDDVYVCQAAGLPNRLYRNQGDGTFEDVTDSSGTGVLENTACALFADFNNDGRQDLVVVRANGPLLFLNQGGGRFKLKPDAFRFANPPQGTFTGAAAADYDRDGNLDIYFCLYVYYQGADQYKSPTPYFAAENGPPNFLMKNNGDGTFRDVTKQCGLDKNNTRFSFCCGWSDYNRDGWPDLYVVNDFGKKNLYRNNGDGTFSDLAHEAGVEDVGAGMSVCWLDYGNNGMQDLYVANMWTAAGARITDDQAFQKTAPEPMQAMYRKHAMGNSLLRNEGTKFRDVTEASHTGVGRWAWSSDAWDFDHDGFSDIYVTNGMVSGPIREDLNSFFWRQVVSKSPNVAKSDPEYDKGWNAINELIRADYSWSGFERNILYANNGDGTFSDVSGAAGMDFLEDGRAFAVADLDGDGRQEILVKNRNAPQLRLMKSTAATLPPAISFRLLGTRSNRDAIGASVTVETKGGRQTKMLQAGSGFLSQHSKELFFGLGAANSVIAASIRWPSGLVQELGDLPGNHRVWVTEGLKPTRVESFKPREVNQTFLPPREEAPDQSETWLLVPVSAPMFVSKGKPALLSFESSPAHGSSGDGFELVKIATGEQQNEDLCAVFNLLFRSLFDRHCDLPLPSSFLIDEQGKIVKIYRGAVKRERVDADVRRIPRTDKERLMKALPFPGILDSFEFARNYLSLGSIFFQRGYLGPADDFFQSALKSDPLSAEAFYGLGSVYLNQKRNDQARKCFESAARSKAAYPETMPNTWNNLGLLATREGDTDGAVTFFKKALDVNPDHFVALENLGNAYRQQKRWGDARISLERALTLSPEDAVANYSLGMVLAQMDDDVRAYDYLQKALQARPVYPEALNNLGVLYLRTRRRNDAVTSFERCIKMSPSFNQSYLNLARVYAIEGNSEKARSVLKALLTQHPDDAAAVRALEQLR